MYQREREFNAVSQAALPNVLSSAAPHSTKMKPLRQNLNRNHYCRLSSRPHTSSDGSPEELVDEPPDAADLQSLRVLRLLPLRVHHAGRHLRLDAHRHSAGTNFGLNC